MGAEAWIKEVNLAGLHFGLLRMFLSLLNHLGCDISQQVCDTFRPEKNVHLSLSRMLRESRNPKSIFIRTDVRLGGGPARDPIRPGARSVEVSVSQ